MIDGNSAELFILREAESDSGETSCR